MSPNPTRVYRLVTVTPRLISAMMPSDEALLDENSLALMGIAFPPRNCHSRPSQGSRTTQKVVPHPMQKAGCCQMEHAPQGTGIPVFDRKSTTSALCTMHGAGQEFHIVIPGRAPWRELWCAIAHLRIHTHDRGYGFSGVQLHTKARRFASPRNDEERVSLLRRWSWARRTGGV